MKRIITVYHGIGNLDKFMEVPMNMFLMQLKYLKRKKFNGVLQDVSREYNESFKGMYPYFYNLNLFYALKYVNIER